MFNNFGRPSAYDAAQASNSFQMVENTEATAKLLKSLMTELEKEKAERQAADKRSTRLAAWSLIIGVLTLISSIVVPVVLQHLR